MLSISHGLTGAFIATQLQHPGLFVPLTLASHYLEDWIPHWDVGTGLSNGKRKRSTAILLELVDLAITAGLIYLFWGSAGTPTLYLAAVGAFIALLPDFIEAPRNFLNWEPRLIKPINRFHNLFHHSVPNILFGVIPQILLVAVIFLLK